MQNLAYKAYGDVTSRTAGDHQIEYALFQQITDALRLVAAAEAPALSVWADALHRNLELWTRLSADLLHPQNTIPDETKAGLLSLARFVRQTSLQVLAGEPGIDDLIEINTTIMAGLCGAGDGVATEDAA